MRKVIKDRQAKGYNGAEKTGSSHNFGFGRALKSHPIYPLYRWLNWGAAKVTQLGVTVQGQNPGLCQPHHSAEFIFLRVYLFILRQRARMREKLQCVVASHAPLMGTWPASQACALTGNRTSDLLVHRPVLNSLSHTSQGSADFREQFAKATREMTKQLNTL